MEILITLFIAFGISWVIFRFFILPSRKDLETHAQLQEKIKQCQEVLSTAESDLGKLNTELASKRAEKKIIDVQIEERTKRSQQITESVEEQQKQALALVEKEYALQREQQKDNNEAKLKVLQKSFEQASLELRQSSGIDRLQKEIQSLRQIYTVLKERRKNIDEENFKSLHSILISEDEIEVISKIENFFKRINYSLIGRKAIWTEFIQPQVQALCKSLGADKTSGIYQILNSNTGELFIGSSKDIGMEWKTIFKMSLGVEKSTNAFLQLTKNLKDNFNDFTFEILEECLENELQVKQSHWERTIYDRK